jgi:UDPglucose 6-dehydrogenase
MKNDPRYVTGTWEECESIKIFYNTFISAKIGLVNMIQDFAIKIGNINVDVVTDALANSNIRIMSTKYMTAGLGDSGACHPRDNIALRWLAKEYNLGYDLFDTIMSAREIQAKNLADFLLKIAKKNDLPIVIHGKAYKPDVPYCIGSYSTLIGTFIQAQGWPMVFVDPLADDQQNVVDTVTDPAVILLAHNRNITYGYTNLDQPDRDYYDFVAGSIVVDPWRRYPQKPGLKVIHYGNTRK